MRELKISCIHKKNMYKGYLKHGKVEIVVSRKRKKKAKIDDDSMESPVKEEVMSKELYEAARWGNYEYVINESDEYLCRKTLQLNNMLHIAILHKKVSFVDQVVVRFPHLLWEPNIDGNTPFHFAAESKYHKYKYFVKKVCDEVTDVRRLRMKNSMGNTALHLAIFRGRIKTAIILLEKDPKLATLVNDFAEAPLHLAIKCFQEGYNALEGWERKEDYWTDKKEKCISHVKNKKTNLDSNERLNKEEKSVIMIIALLEKASEVASWRDGSGLTPLHQAASLHKTINLSLISCMIEYYPECLEVCDTSGKTILHHLINRIAYASEAHEILWDTDVECFVNHQDKDGNTPCHLAAKDFDLITLQLCFNNWNDADPGIRNKEGKSVNDYILQSGDFQKLRQNKALIPMTDETLRIIERGDLYLIMEHRKKIGSSFLIMQDSEGRNVMHRLLLLIKSGCVILPRIFIHLMNGSVCEIPDDYRVKICTQTDKNGDTVAHILAQLNPHNIMIHLATAERDDDEIDDDERDNKKDRPINQENLYPGPQKPVDPIYYSSPYTNCTFEWVCLGNSQFFKDLTTKFLKRLSFQKEWLRMQNKKGNTCLHEAILANNYLVFTEFAKQYEESGGKLVNNQNETILHLLATQNSTPPTTIDEAMIHIIKSDLNTDCNFLDVDGRTPIMRAVEVGNLSFAERLWNLMSVHNPKFNELKGRDGQTFWHLLAKLPRTSFESTHSFFTDKDVCCQLKIKDKDENTALHLAIDGDNLGTAHFFLESYQKQNFDESLLDIRNKKGDTPGDMIGSLPYLTTKLERFLLMDSRLVGYRSKWGIPTTKMDNYVNAIGVIAALVFTVTFTAAFTVPGGLDQEKGTPLLIGNSAFQVFIISDVLSMCLSMMVVFCLLSILAARNKRESVKLMDLSITLLIAAFFTTHLTFISGLYATLHLVNFWIAILTLVLGLMLLFFMLGYVVMRMLFPEGVFQSVRSGVSRLTRAVRPPQPEPEPEQPISTGDHIQISI